MSESSSVKYRFQILNLLRALITFQFLGTSRRELKQKRSIYHTGWNVKNFKFVFSRHINMKSFSLFYIFESHCFTYKRQTALTYDNN